MIGACPSVSAMTTGPSRVINRHRGGNKRLERTTSSTRSLKVSPPLIPEDPSRGDPPLSMSIWIFPVATAKNWICAVFRRLSRKLMYVYAHKVGPPWEVPALNRGGAD